MHIFIFAILVFVVARVLSMIPIHFLFENLFDEWKKYNKITNNKNTYLEYIKFLYFFGGFKGVGFLLSLKTLKKYLEINIKIFILGIITVFILLPLSFIIVLFLNFIYTKSMEIEL